MTQYSSRIMGTGIGIPSKTLTNHDLEKIVDTSDEWIRTRTGIEERKIIDAEGGETLTDIVSRAAKNALERCGVSASELDLIILGTTSPDTLMPGTGARLTGELGLHGIPALDVNAACSGFLFALHTADALIKSGKHKKILVVGGEHISSVINWKDRNTCVLFGDGSGAVVVEAVENADPSKDSMILGSRIFTNFDEQGNLTVDAGGSRYPAHHPKVGKEVHSYVKMNGPEVFKAGSRGMAEAAKALLSDLKVSSSDIKWFVPHQANKRIIEMVAKILDFPMERVFVNLQRWGNTSAATIPICLWEMVEEGKLQKGDLILIDTFGAGFSFGAALVRW